MLRRRLLPPKDLYAPCETSRILRGNNSHVWRISLIALAGPLGIHPHIWQNKLYGFQNSYESCPKASPSYQQHPLNPLGRENRQTDQARRNPLGRRLQRGIRQTLRPDGQRRNFHQVEREALARMLSRSEERRVGKEC